MTTTTTTLQCGRCCLAAEAAGSPRNDLGCVASMWPLLLSSGKPTQVGQGVVVVVASMWPLLLSSGKQIPPIAHARPE